MFSIILTTNIASPKLAKIRNLKKISGLSVQNPFLKLSKTSKNRQSRSKRKFKTMKEVPNLALPKEIYTLSYAQNADVGKEYEGFIPNLENSGQSHIEQQSANTSHTHYNELVNKIRKKIIAKFFYNIFYLKILKIYISNKQY